MLALNKKNFQIARKTIQRCFPSEKFKNIFLNLSQKIYMKVSLLVELNTSVGPQFYFFS